MTNAVALGATATAPQERGWRWFVLSLVLMVAITAIPLWPPALALIGAVVRLALPIEQFALLTLVAIASCAIVGWWNGARLFHVVGWVLVAAWILWKAPLSSGGYSTFVRGWAMSLGAGFGLVSIASSARPFLGRAVAAIGLAGVVTLAGLAVRGPASGSVFSPAERMFTMEYQRRLDDALNSWRQRTQSPTWQAFSRRLPDAAATAEQSVATVVALGQPASAATRGGPLLRLVPALLALESLLALALGWATYHRLSRARIGPPLGALRNLRFNDQWIWGLVVGFTALLLPTLAEWRTAGFNLIVFFGLLYSVRGIGVLVWWIPERLAVLLPLVLILLVPVLGPEWVLLVAFALAFGVGLSDTWRNYRRGNDRRPSSARP